MSSLLRDISALQSTNHRNGNCTTRRNYEDNEDLVPPPVPRSEESDEDEYEDERKAERSLENRRKFVDFRKHKKLGGEINSQRISNVVVKNSSGQETIKRASQILKAFASGMQEEEDTNVGDILSSDNFKNRVNNPVAPAGYVRNHEQPVRGTTNLNVAERIIAGGSVNELIFNPLLDNNTSTGYENHASTATDSTAGTTRSSALVPVADPDYGLESKTLQEMNKDDMNNFANNQSIIQQTNDIYGADILDEEVATKINQEKKHENIKYKKKQIRQEKRRKRFEKITSAFKSSKPKDSNKKVDIKQNGPQIVHF